MAMFEHYFTVAVDIKHVAKVHLPTDIYWITDEDSLIGICTYTKNINFETIGNEVSQKLIELEFPDEYGVFEMED